MQREVSPDRLDGLSGPDQGLTAQEVAERRARYGPNTIVAERDSGWLEIARSTLRDPMLWFLLGTAMLFLWLGDVTEAIVLIAALVPIAGMDAYLHRRTDLSTEGLRARLAPQARVLRDGALRAIPAVALVPGDLVVVEAGMYFPADGLIVSGTGLQADESTLTGEALPVRKLPLDHPPRPGDAPVGILHWGMAGTRLLTGTARLRVTQTGAETFYGEIARLSESARTERTPLQEAITGLVRVLLVLALLLCAALAAIRLAQGYGAVDALLSAVTLAIAALPEEFPVVFSFFLGVGVYRLARRRALVRRAVVVENIGRITCICTDKTGTLTEGRLGLEHVIPATAHDRQSVLTIAATASRRESADPLDLILLDAARPIAGRVEALFPFTEDRLREVAVMRGDTGFRVAIKGAPETVLDMCAMDEAARAQWQARVHTLAGAGQKVIATADLTLPEWTGIEPTGGFRLAGLIGFADPVRPGTADAVRAAQAAGIRVVMITGDHARTAAAIAREVGIGNGAPRVIDGADLTGLLEQGGAGQAGFDVVARCTPSQKLALVRALRARGEVVAVTGDGVNDAPALRGADVGIAMGERGTRSARDVAAIVLLDDDFSTIIRAIAEGQQLFGNLRLSFAYLLMLHAPLVATAALIPLLGYPLLYLPIHIVWIELILHPTAMLVFQSLEATGDPQPADRRGPARFFSRREWGWIAAAGGVATLVILAGYIFNIGPEGDVAHARSMALGSLVLAGAAVTAALTRLRSTAAIAGTLLPVASALGAIEVAPLAQLLHLAPLHRGDWMLALSGSIAVGLLAFRLTTRQATATEPIRPGNPVAPAAGAGGSGRH